MRNKLILSLICVLMLTLTAFAQEGPPPPELDGEIVIQELNGPQGLFLADDGTLYVIDSGTGGDETISFINPTTLEPAEGMFGQTSRILRWSEGSDPEVVTTLPSITAGEDALGGADLTMLDDVLYATVGSWHGSLGDEVTIDNYAGVVSVTDGEVEQVADLWAHELANNPDETDNVETHPFGLTAGPDGLLYVADAAANTLISVDPETGETTTVAVFEGLPGIFPSAWRDGELITDPVPTRSVFGEDGTIYVSLLSGAPFVPGSAKVVQVAEDGTVSDFATGLTMLTDLKMGPDGNLYAVSFGMFTEEGPVFNSGSVIRILEDGTSEVVIDGLPFATALAIDADGNGYVTINGTAIPGAGMVVYYEGLTDMEGMSAEMEG